MNNLHKTLVWVLVILLAGILYIVLTSKPVVEEPTEPTRETPKQTIPFYPCEDEKCS